MNTLNTVYNTASMYLRYYPQQSYLAIGVATLALTLLAARCLMKGTGASPRAKALSKNSEVVEFPKKANVDDILNQEYLKELRKRPEYKIFHDHIKSKGNLFLSDTNVKACFREVNYCINEYIAALLDVLAESADFFPRLPIKFGKEALLVNDRLEGFVKKTLPECFDLGFSRVEKERFAFELSNISDTPHITSSYEVLENLISKNIPVRQKWVKTENYEFWKSEYAIFNNLRRDLFTLMLRKYFTPCLTTSSKYEYSGLLAVIEIMNDIFSYDPVDGDKFSFEPETIETKREMLAANSGPGKYTIKDIIKPVSDEDKKIFNELLKRGLFKDKEEALTPETAQGKKYKMYP